MHRRLRVGFNVRCLALGSAALPWAGACLAADPGPAPSISGREIMFYISQPIGPGAAPRSFGLRIDQHSNPGALPGGTSSAAELSGRRDLVNLRMSAHENPRIEIGRHISWDFTRRQFTQPSDAILMTGGFPNRATTATAAISRPSPAAAQAMPVTAPLSTATRARPALP